MIAGQTFSPPDDTMRILIIRGNNSCVFAKAIRTFNRDRHVPLIRLQLRKCHQHQ